MPPQPAKTRQPPPVKPLPGPLPPVSLLPVPLLLEPARPASGPRSAWGRL
jgi:hypothetical protein